MIDKMDYDKILSMYQDRYKDASDFTFIFVGNVNVEEMKPLIAEYLGSTACHSTARKHSRTIKSTCAREFIRMSS